MALAGNLAGLQWNLTRLKLSQLIEIGQLVWRSTDQDAWKEFVDKGQKSRPDCPPNKHPWFLGTLEQTKAGEHWEALVQMSGEEDAHAVRRFRNSMGFHYTSLEGPIHYCNFKKAFNSSDGDPFGKPQWSAAVEEQVGWLHPRFYFADVVLQQAVTEIADSQESLHRWASNKLNDAKQATYGVVQAFIRFRLGDYASSD